MNVPFAIDVHTHLGTTRAFRARYGAIEDFIRLMDTTRTQLSILSSMALLDYQMEPGYEETDCALAEYPDRLRAYTVFNPDWPEISLKLMDEHQSLPGYVGVKIHPANHQTPPEDPRYREFWDYCEEHHLVVLSHTWSPDPAKPAQDLSTPDRFAGILESHPNVRLILGHCGGRPEGNRRAVDLMRRFPNCWADLSGDNFSNGLVEWLANEVGAERLLFGTDSNWIEPRYHLGYILKSNLSPGDRYAIFRGNALAVFGERLDRLSPVTDPVLV